MRSGSRNILPFSGAMAIGIGLGIACCLLVFWIAVNRENLIGVNPERSVYRVKVFDENRRPLAAQELDSIVRAAFPAAPTSLVRYVRAEVEDGHGGKRVERAALYTGELFDLLGVEIDWRSTASSPAGRLAIATPSLLQSLGKAQLPSATISLRSTHPELAASPVVFEVSGTTRAEFGGISLGETPAFWVNQDAWKNWLIPDREPELLLDVVYPLDSIILGLSESLDPDEVADRISAVATAKGMRVTTHVIEGAARNPLTLDMVRTRSTLISVLAVALLVVAISAGLSLWLFFLIRQQSADRIRMLLGEPRTFAMRRVARLTAAVVSGATVLALVVVVAVVRIAAARPPFQEIATGPWLLGDSEWLPVLIVAVIGVALVALLLALAGSTFVDGAHRAARQVSGRPVAIRRLLALSMGIVVLAISLGLGSMLAGNALARRDFGFRTDGLISVRVERDPKRWQEWIFDQRESRPILVDIEKRLAGVSKHVRLAASSQSPFGAYANKDFRLTSDREDRSRMSSQVSITPDFFSVLEAESSTPLQAGGDLYPRTDRIWVDGRFALDVLDGDLALRAAPGILSPDAGFANNPLRPVAVVPSIFRSRMDEPPAPTLFRALTLANEIEWIWLRDEGSHDPAKVRAIVESVLRDHGVNVLRVVASRLSEDVEFGMRGEVVQQQILAAFSFALLFLSLAGLCALLAFTGRMQRKVIAIRTAVGASRIRALLESVGPPPLWSMASIALMVAISMLWIRSASVLYGFGAFEMFTFPAIAVAAALAIGLLVVAFLAFNSRATDPYLALRDE